MISEAFYDSVLIAGNLMGERKWRDGENVRNITETIRIALPPEPEEEKKEETTEAATTPAPKSAAESTVSTTEPSMSRKMMLQTRVIGGYDLEQGLEIDFDALLSDTKKGKGELAMMKKMSDTFALMKLCLMMKFCSKRSHVTTPHGALSSSTVA